MAPESTLSARSSLVRLASLPSWAGMEPENRLPERSRLVSAKRLPSSVGRVPGMPWPEEVERSRPVTRLPETVTPLQSPILALTPIPQVLSGWVAGSC